LNALILSSLTTTNNLQGIQLTKFERKFKEVPIVEEEKKWGDEGAQSLYH